LDDLVCPRQHRWWDRQSERLGGFEVDDQLELGGLFDGEVGGLCAFEDLVDVGCRASNLVVKVHRIGHEAACLNKLPLSPYRRYLALGREVHEGFSILSCQKTRGPEKRVGALPGHGDKGALEPARSSHLEWLQCKTQCRGRLLQ